MDDYIKLLVAACAIFGGAITWLWSEYGKLRKRIEDCEKGRAELHVKLDTAHAKIGEVQGTCSTLTELLRKEINVG